MVQTQQRPPQPIKVAIETEEPEKIGTSWSILTTAIVSQGNRVLDERQVQFFLNGLPFDQPAPTDDNGRAQIDVTGIPLDAKRVSVEAQIVGQTFRARRIVSLPETKKSDKEQIPVELIVHPRRIGNEINLFIRVTDEENRGVPNAYVDIVDGHIVTPKPVNEYGELLETITLDSGQEREISVYVAGFGDSGFCKTFKGREDD